MAINDWKLAEDLNVYQIALLSAGHDPSEYEEWEYGDWPRQTKEDAAAFLNIVKYAARSGKIEFVEILASYSTNEIDWHKSLINIDSYRRWLKSRNHTDKFFNCAESDLDALSFPFGQFYAPKLAAAVRAWTEVTSDPEALNGKTPKRALEIWLRKHANEYGLTNKDGNTNNQGIEEVCKVANWKPQGGASRTPTPLLEPTPRKSPRGAREAEKPPTPEPSFDLDDEIPF